MTALNPLIGYSQGAELVKEAAARSLTIHDIAVEKAKAGMLKHVDGDRLITVEEIEAALAYFFRTIDNHSDCQRKYPAVRCPDFRHLAKVAFIECKEQIK